MAGSPFKPVRLIECAFEPALVFGWVVFTFAFDLRFVWSFVMECLLDRVFAIVEDCLFGRVFRLVTD